MTVTTTKSLATGADPLTDVWRNLDQALTLLTTEVRARLHLETEEADHLEALTADATGSASVGSQTLAHTYASLTRPARACAALIAAIETSQEEIMALRRRVQGRSDPRQD